MRTWSPKGLLQSRQAGRGVSGTPEGPFVYISLLVKIHQFDVPQINNRSLLVYKTKQHDAWHAIMGPKRSTSQRPDSPRIRLMHTRLLHTRRWSAPKINSVFWYNQTARAYESLRQHGNGTLGCTWCCVFCAGRAASRRIKLCSVTSPTSSSVTHDSTTA